MPKRCACGHLHETLPAEVIVCERGIIWFQCQAAGCESTLIVLPKKGESHVKG